MGEWFASLHTIEWVYLALFCSALLYALFLAVFGFGHGHGVEHAGDVGHGDFDLGHGDVHVDLGHGDVHVDLGHAGDIGHVGDIGHGADVGLDHSVEMDFDADLDADFDTNGHQIMPWNPIVVGTFFAGFGGGGLLATQWWQLSPGLSLLAAAPAGLVLGGGMYYLYNRILAIAHTDSTVTWQDVYRIPAVVLTPIPENGLGEIVYTARGSRHSAPARSIDGQAIARDSKVTILNMDGPVAVVDLRYVD